MTTCDGVFENGLTFPDYRARLRVHKRAFDEHYARLAFVVARERAHAPLRSNRLLVLTEDYCIDSVLNVPLVARLAEASADARLRIASRDAHAGLAADFPGRGGASRLPTVIFLGRPGEVVGYWSERSEEDHRWMAKFLAADPMPEFLLKDGAPVSDLAAWMERRFAAQQPFVESQSWRDVRNELAHIASMGAPRGRKSASRATPS